MKYADVVESIMRKLVIARDADVGEILAARGYYRTENLSARNNARKILKYLTELGRLEEGGEYFRLPGCKSEFKQHSSSLTKALVKILKVFPDSQVVREKEIPAVKLVPDSLVLISKENKGLVCILEAVTEETPEYLKSKYDVWQNWDKALNFLSQTFGYRVPHFEIVAYPESPIKEVWNFDEFMKEAIG